MTTDTLRAAIEAALRRRDPEASVRAIDAKYEGLAMTGVSVLGVRMSAVAPATADALRALAIAAGLRDDGSDPAEEVERLTAALDRAHHALREYGPRCSHPDCDALAPLRCDDCGSRFCDAHDEGGEGHNEIAGDRHAVGPDDLMAGAAMRAAEASR